MLENILLKDLMVIFGLADAGISAALCVSLTIVYFKYKDVKTRLSKGETKSDKIMAEIQSHVTGCQEKAEEAARIRSEMQTQLGRIEGFLEGHFKGKKK